MDATTNESENTLANTGITRRSTLTAAAWSVPVIAVATAVPAAVASGEFNPEADFRLHAPAGAEGRYSTGGNYWNSENIGTNDFRRMLELENIGEGTFTGNLVVRFKIPGAWNEGVSGRSVDAFSNWGVRDLGAIDGATINGNTGNVSSGASGFTVTDTGGAGWVQNVQDAGAAEGPTTGAVWPDVWYRMDDVEFTINNVVIPPGGKIRFALNASVPDAWIHGSTGPNSYLPGWIVWRSAVTVDAFQGGTTYLGTFNAGTEDWANGIWYFNGGGPYSWSYPGTPRPGNTEPYGNYGTA